MAVQRDLGKELQAFRIRCISATVTVDTFNNYARVCDRIVEETGEALSYKSLIRYLHTHRHRLGAQTIRGYKSAVVFCLGLEGNPLSKAEDEDLNRIVAGLSVLTGRPPRVRGAPNPQQVKDVAQRALNKNMKVEGQAVILGYGCCLRPRDLLALKVASVDLTAKIVWVEKKGRIVNKVRYGAFEDRPIGTNDALRLLTTLVKNAYQRDSSLPPRHRLLLPDLKLNRISRLVKEEASEGEWSSELLWDGAHSVGRHAAASETMRWALDQVRARGSWSSPQAAAGYAKQARVVPAELIRGGKRPRID